MYNDHAQIPADFEKINVLYQYPANYDQLDHRKICSNKCGAKIFIKQC